MVNVQEYVKCNITELTRTKQHSVGLTSAELASYRV
jgi:hypothetical protein